MERNCTAVCWTVSRKHTRQRDTLACTEVQQVHNCIVHSRTLHKCNQSLNLRFHPIKRLVGIQLGISFT